MPWPRRSSSSCGRRAGAVAWACHGRGRAGAAVGGRRPEIRSRPSSSRHAHSPPATYQQSPHRTWPASPSRSARSTAPPRSRVPRRSSPSRRPRPPAAACTPGGRAGAVAEPGFLGRHRRRARDSENCVSRGPRALHGCVGGGRVAQIAASCASPCLAFMVTTTELTAALDATHEHEEGSGDAAAAEESGPLARLLRLQRVRRELLQRRVRQLRRADRGGGRRLVLANIDDMRSDVLRAPPPRHPSSPPNRRDARTTPTPAARADGRHGLRDQPRRWRRGRRLGHDGDVRLRAAAASATTKAAMSICTARRRPPIRWRRCRPAPPSTPTGISSRCAAAPSRSAASTWTRSTRTARADLGLLQRPRRRELAQTQEQCRTLRAASPSSRRRAAACSGGLRFRRVTLTYLGNLAPLNSGQAKEPRRC